eukprot:scaffold181513_cov59-Attheya_sp.AAC.2
MCRTVVGTKALSLSNNRKYPEGRMNTSKNSSNTKMNQIMHDIMANPKSTEGGKNASLTWSMNMYHILQRIGAVETKECVSLGARMEFCPKSIQHATQHATQPFVAQKVRKGDGTEQDQTEAFQAATGNLFVVSKHVVALFSSVIGLTGILILNIGGATPVELYLVHEGFAAGSHDVSVVTAHMGRSMYGMMVGSLESGYFAAGGQNGFHPLGIGPLILPRVRPRKLTRYSAPTTSSHIHVQKERN